MMRQETSLNIDEVNELHESAPGFGDYSAKGKCNSMTAVVQRHFMAETKLMMFQ